MVAGSWLTRGGKIPWENSTQIQPARGNFYAVQFSLRWYMLGTIPTTLGTTLTILGTTLTMLGTTLTILGTTLTMLWYAIVAYTYP